MELLVWLVAAMNEVEIDLREPLIVETTAIEPVLIYGLGCCRCGWCTGNGLTKWRCARSARRVSRRNGPPKVLR